MKRKIISEANYINASAFVIGTLIALAVVFLALAVILSTKSLSFLFILLGVPLFGSMAYLEWRMFDSWNHYSTLWLVTKSDFRYQDLVRKWDKEVDN